MCGCVNTRVFKRNIYLKPYPIEKKNICLLNQSVTANIVHNKRLPPVGTLPHRAVQCSFAGNV